MPRSRQRPVEPEDLYAFRRVSFPRISPDGRRVAYVVSSADREADRAVETVWIADLDGAQTPRAFTGADSSGAPQWSPDGRWLAFVSRRGEGGAQLWVAPLDGGEARALTRGEASASDPRWSPDGKRIAFVRSVGPRRGKAPAERNAPRVFRDLYYKLDGFGLYDDRRRHLFVVDIETGEEQQLTDGDWHDTQPSWSPDGRAIAFVSERRPERWSELFRSDVWVVPSRGGKARCLTRSRGSAASPAFSPDGSRVAFVGHEHGDRVVGRNSYLCVVNARGSRAPRALTESIDRSVPALAAFGSPFEWLPDGEALLFLAPDRGAVPIWRVELASGAAKKVVAGDFAVMALSVAPDGREVAFTSAWSSALPEVWAASLEGSPEPRRISDANAELRGATALGRTERIAYRAPDGLEIEAFVLFPPGYRRDRRYPLALEIHGGPHGAHPSTYNLLQHQTLAGAGYVVLMVNPRGSTSYGEAFERGCIEDWGGGDYEDLMAGVDALIDRGIADPERLYVCGYSYGGYMSSWIVGQTARFGAAAIGAPITDLVSSFGTDDIPHFSIESMGGTPDARPDDYRRRSPLTWASRVRTPVLLLHWEGDLRCPIAQSEQLFTALKLAGRKVEMVRYPGGAHGIRSPSQDVDYARRAIDWFQRHEGGRRKRTSTTRTRAGRRA